MINECQRKIVECSLFWELQKFKVILKDDEYKCLKKKMECLLNGVVMPIYRC